jgi:hypothetical protein
VRAKDRGKSRPKYNGDGSAQMEAHGVTIDPYSSRTFDHIPNGDD